MIHSFLGRHQASDVVSFARSAEHLHTLLNDGSDESESSGCRVIITTMQKLAQSYGDEDYYRQRFMTNIVKDSELPEIMEMCI